ncbi:MAG: hypothetical protein WBX01_14110 [Nitrososphaeraceae archaeon]
MEWLLGLDWLENHGTFEGVEGSYPLTGSYDQIFLTAGLLSGVTVVFALLLRRTANSLTHGA